METEPEKHTWHCLYEIQSCRDSGYTINQETAGQLLLTISAGSGQYFPMYMLDEPGNVKAIELLAASEREDNMWVKVTGVVNGSTSTTTKYTLFLTASEPTAVIQVESIVESTPQSDAVNVAGLLALLGAFF